MKNKLIVVAGAAGKLGRLVIDAVLQDPSARVRALVRDPKKPEAALLARDRVELVELDVVSAGEGAREAAVRGAWAVVSTLQGGPDVIIDAQLALLRAAKAAGARRFVPSDYSFDFFGLPEGVNVNSDWRRTFAERAKTEVTETFEVVHVLQGIFADAYVLGFLGLLDGEKGVVRYWGDGTTPIDWTTWEDTARFTAAAALDERPVPERLYVAGDRMDVLTFVKTWEAAHGRKLTVERLGSLDDLAAETRRRLQAEPANMYAWLPLMYARGVFSGQALLGPTLNDRYPHIAAEPLTKAMARGAL
ncbi:MAG: NmrA family NAD(P)-binding protein [Deltaproteobacteria bacterium]|nr:NmrA family NAD(P)-binding protein [Deltaproteobacteria bacterium]